MTIMPGDDPPPQAGGAYARQRIRAERMAVGRRTAVLDDDPTGSQSVHSVSVVPSFEQTEREASLSDPGSVCFILTNTRSLPEAEAVRLNRSIGAELFEFERKTGAPLDIVSRSDSTLRGHVIAEVETLNAARRNVLGRGFDAVLLVPSYFEAGRFTADDVHYARVDGRAVPVGETEFAADATFGYHSSNLRDFIEEKSRGRIPAGRVRSLSLDDIRSGGADRVAELLSRAANGEFVVVNATDYVDLETVVQGVQKAEADGKTFLHRTGPSFVRALAGIDPVPELSSADIWADGAAARGHGLIVVGSHVAQTDRQIARARERCTVFEVELSVGRLLTGSLRAEHIAETSRRVADALPDADVLVYTSRGRVEGADPAASLSIASTISDALVQVIRSVRQARPGWVIAKGGITSHDIAVQALGIRRATVLGQLFPGMVSVLIPEAAPPDVIGIPYVVFAGNVGDDNALADAIDLLRPNTH